MNGWLKAMNSTQRARALDAAILVALFGLALALRLPLAGTDPFGDEAVHYHVARDFGQPPAHVDNPPPDRSLLWGRPAFFLLLAPAAQASFVAFRLEHILLASLLPSLVAVLARAWGAQRPFAAAAGLAVAVHPLYVLYGVHVFPDALLTLWSLLALWARRHGRMALAAILLVVACWTKEVGLVLAGALLAADMARGIRAGTVGLWPLRATAEASLGLFAALAGAAPLAASQLLGARFPGWSTGGPAWALVDLIPLSVWLLLPLVTATLRARTRSLSVLALVYPAFYLLYRFVLGRRVEEWYALLPGALALAALAVLLGSWIEEARGSRRLSRIVGTMAVAAALLLVAVSPTIGHPFERVTRPFTTSPGPDLVALERDLPRQHDLQDAAAYLRAHHAPQTLLVDVGWFFVVYPFSDDVDELRYRFSDGTADQADGWARELEQDGLTIVLWNYESGKVNTVLRRVYSDCVVYRNAGYSIVDGSGCGDHRDELAAELGKVEP